MTTVDRTGLGAPSIPRSAIREPGTVLGSYRLQGVLGEGGMGVVYLAEHVTLGRHVALKMLRPELASNAQAVRRFFAEARAVNRICHHNIVEITDFLQEPGGDSYYIMEFLRGESLATVIDRAMLPLQRAIGIMVQVASALEAVHDAGIIHRDLKPDNIFLIEHAGRRDFVKLLDFGVAELLELRDDPLARSIVGTPEYMSPEQAAGMPLDHRSDVYAFGVILYELVTGMVPFDGVRFEEVASKHLSVAPTRPTALDPAWTIPPALEQLILECLAKHPSGRPPAMDAVRARLLGIAASEALPINTFGELDIHARMRTIKSSAPPPVGARTEEVTPLPPPPSATTGEAVIQDAVHATPTVGTKVPGKKGGLAALIVLGVLVAAVGIGLAVRHLHATSTPATAATPPGTTPVATAPGATPGPSAPGTTASTTGANAASPTGAATPAASAITTGTATPAATNGTATPTSGEPAPAATAATAEPEPDTIEIRFETTPPGAQVYRKGAVTSIGTTPFTYEAPRDVGIATFELRMSGRKSAKLDVPLDDSTRVLVGLVELSHRGPAPAAQTERIRRLPATPAGGDTAHATPPAAPTGAKRSSTDPNPFKREVKSDDGFRRFD